MTADNWVGGNYLEVKEGVSERWHLGRDEKVKDPTEGEGGRHLLGAGNFRQRIRDLCALEVRKGGQGSHGQVDQRQRGQNVAGKESRGQVRQGLGGFRIIQSASENRRILFTGMT